MGQVGNAVRPTAYLNLLIGTDSTRRIISIEAIIKIIVVHKKITDNAPLWLTPSAEENDELLSEPRWIVKRLVNPNKGIAGKVEGLGIFGEYQSASNDIQS